MTVAAFEFVLDSELKRAVLSQDRDSDLLGHTDRGTPTMVLLDADFGHAKR